MSWFSKSKKNITCNKCGNINFYVDRIREYHVCANCGTHNKIPIEYRIKQLFEEDSVTLYNEDKRPKDILNFVDSKKYTQRIKDSINKTKFQSAVVTGYGKIGDITVNFSILNFEFMGGSLGSVEGEKITQCILKAIKYKTPVLIISSSGGARMQESSISLMQMAKTSAALRKLSHVGLPYVSFLTNPTMGGVSASFAFLGDLIVAEPGATIGFAGQRVIQQTIQSKLPDNFQTAEYLLEHGLIDDIVERKNQKDYLRRVFSTFCFNENDTKLIENRLEVDKVLEDNINNVVSK
jgi:acetyl-CoA carboxylase carboxyl transferase subunit beta